MVIKPAFPRARAAHQKQARRDSLLALAETALADTPYAQITMAALAERAGLAKGTLYLSYPTKEALFLDLARQTMGEWFQVMEGVKARTPGPFARRLAALTTERTTLRTLVSLLHGILEQNLPEETALAFKLEMLDRWQRLAAHVERQLGWPQGAGMKRLLQVYALLEGFQSLCDPSPVVRALLDREEMAPYRLDFETCFAEAVESVLGAPFKR